MRRLILAFAFVFIAARADATPFTPDHFRLIITDAQPYTYCFHCDDADVSNDYRVSLSLTGQENVFALFNDIGAGSVSVTTSGPVPAESTILPFAVAATLELWNSAALSDPHSFTNGALRGNLWLSFDRLVECCHGGINTMPFYTVQGFLELPTNGTTSMVLLTTRPTNPMFMPAEVPEPSSVLLLGTGLLAWRRRR